MRRRSAARKHESRLTLESVVAFKAFDSVLLSGDSEARN